MLAYESSEARNGASLGGYMKQPKLSDMEIDLKETKKLRTQIKKAKKVKITINLDESVLSAVKERALESGIPYQNLVNRLLQQALQDKNIEKSRLDKLEEEIKDLKNKFTA